MTPRDLNRPFAPTSTTLALLAALICVAACTGDDGGGDEVAESTSEDTSSAEDTAGSADATESSDSSEDGGAPNPDPAPCEPGDSAPLFGAPSANTGLGSDQCQPSCVCAGGDWAPPSYEEAFIAQLDALTLTNAPALLDGDPYDLDPQPSPDPDSVCGVVLGADSYAMATYADEASAAADGAHVTHRGACGQCSSLANLAVYMRMPDLTEPVRQCGLDGIVQGEAANIQCLMDLGFDEPCAQIWYYNTVNTREACFDVCIEALESPNHLPDGSLNACIQCDEDESGPVFKAVSGRTRRNSGLPSALCRPCDSVYRVIHDYGLL